MRISLISCLLLFGLSASAQPAYKLDFKVDGLKDTTAYLGYYYGESTFVKDTAKVNSKGEFVFDGKQPLRQGVYFIVLNKTRIFEFIIGGSQQFKMSTKQEDYVRNLVVSGDRDNKLCFDDMLFNVERHKEAEPYLAILQDSTLSEDQKKDARAVFSAINDKVTAYQDEVISKHRATLTARMYKSNDPVKLAGRPKRADGVVDRP